MLAVTNAAVDSPQPVCSTLPPKPARSAAGPDAIMLANKFRTAACNTGSPNPTVNTHAGAIAVYTHPTDIAVGASARRVATFGAATLVVAVRTQ